MGTTETLISTHFFKSVSLKEVKELLPPNHCIKHLDDTVATGLQETGCYFVAILNFFAGKTKRKNTYVVRLTLLPVLEDGSTDGRKLECFMCDPYCKELEENLAAELGTQGTWSADRAGGNNKVVWVVLHRPFIVPSRGSCRDLNPLCFVVSPKKSPCCQMWLLLGITPREVAPSLYSVTETSLLPPSHIDHAFVTKPSNSHKDSVPAIMSVQAVSPAQAASYDPKYILKPLSKAVADYKISVAGVVINVKMGMLTMNKTTYDIIKVADKGVTGSTSSPTSMVIKVLHNDKVDWPKDGIPKRGHVVVLKDMMCQQYNDRMEGVVYSTGMVCVCKCDEENHLTWYSSTPGCPHNIENAEEIAGKLFNWFRQHSIQPPSQTAAGLPTYKISDVNGKGHFILNCQVVKKTIHPAPACPMVVLRVRDGTRSPFKFEEINYNPTKRDRELVMGVRGSLEVDILVKTNVIPPELDELEHGSFVQLRGVECDYLYGDCWKLMFMMTNDDIYIKVLGNDDPELLLLKNSVLEATDEGKSPAVDNHDDGCSWDAKNKDHSSSITPPHKRQRLNLCTSGSSSHTTSIRQPLHPSSQSHASSPQSSITRQPLDPSSFQYDSSRPTVYISSPQPSTSRQSQDPSSHPTTSKQLLQPSSPEFLATRHPLLHSSRKNLIHDQSCSTISAHCGALEEVQEIRTAKCQYLSLETFFYEGKVGEIYHVKAAITDIRAITKQECPICRGPDNMCVHQWLWGFCQNCDNTFSCIELICLHSPRELYSQNSLHCTNCIQQHGFYNNGEQLPCCENDHGLVPHHLTSTVRPFIKAKVVVKNPKSGFQQTAWLTGDNANQFFGVRPTFRWLQQEQEMQEAVKALLVQGKYSLALKMVKKEVEGRVDLCIVNTCFCSGTSCS
ncbi:uncharacterized protein LOC135104914 isoform X1 [Scylla paramamosain]|uniref:uncharacterized protein LOC135104914 isoform X1 n=1 Tax=Scylla paramamosain TaxID=85552 RepID=UPI0030835A5C